MRLRTRKLLYLPIGGALAAGLLTSAFVLPQANLVASQDCYGPCPSATSLSLSSSTVSATQERLVDFSVNVSAGTSGANAATKKADANARRTGGLTGSVTVKTGSRVLCRISLSRGRGQCSLANRELRPGSYQVVARYSGDRDFGPSVSGQESLSVRGH